MTPEEVRDKAIRDAKRKLEKANEDRARIDSKIHDLEVARGYVEKAKTHAQEAQAALYTEYADAQWSGSSHEKFIEIKNDNNITADEYIGRLDQMIRDINSKINELRQHKNSFYDENTYGRDVYNAQMNYNVEIGLNIYT